RMRRSQPAEAQAHLLHTLSVCADTVSSVRAGADVGDLGSGSIRSLTFVLTHAETLPIGNRRFTLLFRVREGPRDRALESLPPASQGRRALDGENRAEIANEPLHPPHHLDAFGPVGSDFIQSKPQELVPGGKWNNDPEFALIVPYCPDLQVAATQA